MNQFAFGVWRDPAIDAALIREARASRALPSAEVLGLLDQLGPLWRRAGTARSSWVKTSPERALGWSREMIELGLDQFTRRLDSEAARARIHNQLGSRDLLRSRAAPLGLVLQVIAANIFFGPAEALLAGLITGNTNLIKQPAGDGEFLVAFMRSVEDLNPTALASTALLDWRGGDKKIESFVASNVDAILIAAGSDAVAVYRQLASPNCELIELGPRISAAVVSKKGQEENPNPQAMIAALARDVALWEQSACGSAQTIYVETRAAALQLAEELAGALESLAKELPEATLDLDTRAAIASFRDTARYSGAHRRLFATEGHASVIFEEDLAFRSPPLNRNVLVKPYADPEQLSAALDPIRGYLQTVGLCIGASETSLLIDKLTACGARRFCPLGEMATPAPEIAGDGMHELSRLVRHIAT